MLFLSIYICIFMIINVLKNFLDEFFIDQKDTKFVIIWLVFIYILFCPLSQKITYLVWCNLIYVHLGWIFSALEYKDIINSKCLIDLKKYFWNVYNFLKQKKIVLINFLFIFLKSSPRFKLFWIFFYSIFIWLVFIQVLLSFFKVM